MSKYETNQKTNILLAFFDSEKIIFNKSSFYIITDYSKGMDWNEAV